MLRRNKKPSSSISFRFDYVLAIETHHLVTENLFARRGDVHRGHHFIPIIYSANSSTKRLLIIDAYTSAALSAHDRFTLNAILLFKAL